MKCSIVYLTPLVIIVFSHVLPACSQVDEPPTQRDIYNRMVCENEKLSISCQEPSHVIKIERAYYGRYSITPCNKEHRKFSKGCTASESLQIIRNLCEGKSSCSELINTALFRVDPCPGTQKVLEVTFYCVREKPHLKGVIHFGTIENFRPTVVRATEKSATTSTTTSTTTTTTTTTSTTTTTTSTTTITDPVYSLDSNISMEDYGDVDLSDESGIRNVSSDPVVCRTRVDNTEFNTRLGDYINLPCAMTSSTFFGAKSRYGLGKKPEAVVSGFMLYECRDDGNFYFINSTCAKKKTSKTGNYINENLILVKESIRTIDKLNTHLKNDPNGTLIGNKHLNSLVNFVVNVSDVFYNTDFDSEFLIRNISNTLIETADTLISKTSGWMDLEPAERSRSLTKLMNLIDDLLFDNLVQRIDNDAADKEEKIDFSMDRPNIYAELKTNSDVQNRIVFGAMDYGTMGDELVIDLLYGEKNQKFLFMIFKNVNNFLNSNQTTTNMSRPHLVSNVVSLKVNDINIIDNLKQTPIEITFRHLPYHDHLNNPECVYWKFDKTTLEGVWSTNGCSVQSTNQTHTTCKCNHLTHFAVLADFRESSFDSSQTHRLILTTLTIVVSCISCLCIVLNFSMFRFVKLIKSTREKTTTKNLESITTNVCVCLLLSLLMFLFGVVIQHFKLKQMCSLVGVASHFISLSSYFWTLLQVAHLYLTLERVLINSKTVISKYSLIAYGAPFLIVSASKLLDSYLFDSRGYESPNLCWVSNYNNFDLTFVIPLMCISISNLVVLVVFVCSARGGVDPASRNFQLGFNRRNNRKDEKFFRSLIWIWGSYVIILTSPWLVGYFTIDNQENIVFSYLFVLVNTSQGLVLFLLHCVISRTFRRDLFEAIARFVSQPVHSQSSKFICFCFCSDSKKHQLIVQSQSSSTNLTSKSVTAGAADSFLTSVKLKNLDDDVFVKTVGHRHHTFRHTPSMYYPERNINELMTAKRSSSFVSSSTSNQTTTHSSYVSPILHIQQRILPPLPLVPPPQANVSSNELKTNTLVRMNTFKPAKNQKRKYDENQYLSPAEYHSYSAVDSDTQFYMDDGLSSLKRCKQVDDDDDDNSSNNYVEVMDEMDEFVRTKRLVSSTDSSSNSDSSMAKPASSGPTAFNRVLIDSNENLKAKKILQRM